MHRAGLTLIEALIIGATLVVLAALFIPQALKTRKSNMEHMAIVAIGTIQTAEHALKDNDLDGNGVQD